MKKKWAILVFSLIAAAASAKDFGRRGETFPIQEEDFSSQAQRDLEENFDPEEYAMEMKESVLKPSQVKGIGTAERARSFFVDLSQSFPEDLRIDEENVLVKAGTMINPFDEITLSYSLLFFDGDDEAQVSWAKSQPDDSLWILVKGSPLELMEKEDREIYFDQEGFFTSKLKIQQVPARASQKEKLMFVEEIPVTKEGAEK